MKPSTKYTYTVSGQDGRNMGPLSLEEVRKLAQKGTVTGATFVQRSDSEHWSTAADYEELGIKDVVVTRYDNEASADPLTQEVEKFSHLREVRKGGSWFFWIAALSVINTLAALAGSEWGFALGLSTCYLVGGVGQALGPNGPMIALALNLAACALYLYFGIAAWRGRLTAYGIGMFLYAGDAVLPLLADDWISLGIHALALWFLFVGFKALMDAEGKEWNTALCIKAAACVVLLAGLGGALTFSMRVQAKESAPETWASLPPAEWPQLALSHDGQFKGHTELEGATAFLVDLPNGETVAATARHLLGSAGGVRPALPPAEIDTAIAKWNLHPRSEPDAQVEVAGLFGPPHSYRTGGEWLLLKLKPDQGEDLPAQSLKIRHKPLALDETIYIVGVRYEQKDQRQEVFRAKVVSTSLGLIAGKLEKAADLAGFSGAPVLDSQGHVVAMVTGAWGVPNREGQFMAFACHPIAEVSPLLK